MLEQLLSIKHWHLSEDFMSTVGAVAMKRIEQGKDLSSLLMEQPERHLSGGFQMAENSNYNFKVVENNQGDKLAVIPLYGTMTKWGGLCSYGTVELANMINEANNADDITAIIIDTDSPGGASNSIEVLERAIENTSKPIVGYVNDMAASAALWTMSAVAKKGKVIVDSEQNSSMGSIGTLLIYQNVMAKYKADGVDIELIRAPQSVDKAKPNSLEPLTQELRAEIQTELKELTDTFINKVTENYGDMLKVNTPKLFTGGMFNGKKAVEIGLAHAQGDFAFAANLALDMAADQKKKSFLMNTTMNMFQKFGLSFSIAQKLSAEELENLSTAAERLGEMEKEHAQLTEHNGTLVAQVATLEASVSDRDKVLAERDEAIKSLNAQLEATPEGQSTTVVADEDDQGVEENKYETSADKELAQIQSKLKLSK